METHANAEQQNHKLRENIIPGRDNKYVCHYARNRTDQSLHLTCNIIRNQENITVLPWLITSPLTLMFPLVIVCCSPMRYICDLTWLYCRVLLCCREVLGIDSPMTLKWGAIINYFFLVYTYKLRRPLICLMVRNK